MRLGATRLPPELTGEQFTLSCSPPRATKQCNIKGYFSSATGEGHRRQEHDRGNIQAPTPTAGRINGHKIIEETLNLRDVRIFDYVEDADRQKTGRAHRKENRYRPGQAGTHQASLADWIWKDPSAGNGSGLYNEKFNSNCAREYDGGQNLVPT